MTLHDAMVEVLRAHGGEWMDRDEIAREIARRDLFRRPSDGAPPPSDQLRLRARKYPQLFACSDPRCSRIRLRDDAGAAAARRPPASGARRRPAQTDSATTRLHVPSGPAWYDELRERHRPGRLRLLLIAESPPDPTGGQRRFFYSSALTYDNLYRGVAEALYGQRRDVDLADKPAVLDRLTADGVWLIDATDEPVNRLGLAERAAAIASAVPRLVERCTELAPELGVIVCHAKVFAAAAGSLRAAGVRVLHDDALPFPLGNWRARFVKGVREALTAAGWEWR